MAELESEYKLDPNVEMSLPYDVILQIVEHSDLPTQIKWSYTSRALFLSVSRKIWSSLRVHSSDIIAYALSVSGQRFPSRADSIVHFLLESAQRRHIVWDHVSARDPTSGASIHRPNGVEIHSDLMQLTATLPIAHVKHLEIDNQGFDIQHPVCDQSDMDFVLATLLERIPMLRSFRYLGPFSAKNLASIIQVHSLKVLLIRNGTDVFDPTRPPTFLNIPWIDYTLDWGVIASLKGLQVLEIGRLIRHEATGLAKVVASLKLRRLHVSCWGWEYGTPESSGYIRFRIYTFTLVLFLDALMTLGLHDNQVLRGLPSTLRHLVLIDKYHALLPSFHQLLAAAISPCENLKMLGTAISVDEYCYDTVSRIGLPTYDKIVGLSSWQQLSSDEGMKVIRQYRSPSGEMR